MGQPKAYEPQEGYKFQILVMSPNEREYESLDYATDRADLKHLMNEYRLIYGAGYVLKAIELPQKYWKKKGSITKGTALSNFKLYNSDWLKQHKNDIPAKRLAWSTYVDTLNKDGQITAEQAHNWDNPF